MSFSRHTQTKLVNVWHQYCSWHQNSPFLTWLRHHWLYLLEAWLPYFTWFGASTVGKHNTLLIVQIRPIGNSIIVLTELFSIGFFGSPPRVACKTQWFVRCLREIHVSNWLESKSVLQTRSYLPPHWASMKQAKTELQGTDVINTAREYKARNIKTSNGLGWGLS